MQRDQIFKKLDPYNLNDEELTAFNQFKKQVINEAIASRTTAIRLEPNMRGQNRITITYNKRKINRWIDRNADKITVGLMVITCLICGVTLGP